MERYHEPVLVREILEALEVEIGTWYIDATLGDGGHSLEILRLGGKVLGIDQDLEAINRAEKRFTKVGISQDNFRLVQGNFSNLENLREQTDILDQSFGAVVFDLGVSSLQLEDPRRGFSFMREGPLDMRMDLDLKVSAQDLINGLTKEELSELFFKLGEEKFSKRIADFIVRARKVKKITNTKELAEIIEKAVGGRKGKSHPATKVFQALRIAVNDELNVLKEGLEKAVGLINKGGKILVISFHSLEDRIVKNAFKDLELKKIGKIITKKVIVPSEQEIFSNRRSRSAKLRIFKII